LLPKSSVDVLCHSDHLTSSQTPAYFWS